MRPMASVGYPITKALHDYAEASTLSEPEHRLRVLLICDYQPRNAITVCEHIEAFSRYSHHEFYTYSGKGELPMSIDLEYFDAIIVHYSIFPSIDAYLSPLTRYRIRKFNGLKALFIQDEYQFVYATIRSLEYLGIDMLFTVVPVPEIEKVYPPTCLKHTWRVNVLTGYVNEEMLAVEAPLLADRPIDVGYRGRKYPAWHGQLGLEKWQIGKRFLEDAEKHGLRCDISWSEKDRLYGQNWTDFIRRTKAQLGVESGASVIDFSGEISRRCEDHESQHPNTRYEELRRLYFQEEEGKIRLNQISPRIFEAIVLKSLLILYEGEYSGILKPWRHFVPLRKDHANMQEVVAVLRNLNRAQTIVNCAYDEIACAPRYSYRGFVGAIDQVLSDRFEPHMCARKTAPARKGTGVLNCITGATWAEEKSGVYSWGVRGMHRVYAWFDAIILPRLPKALEHTAREFLRWCRTATRQLMAILRDFRCRLKNKLACGEEARRPRAQQPLTVRISESWSRLYYAALAAVDAQILMRLPDSSRRHVKRMWRVFRRRIIELWTTIRIVGVSPLYFRSELRIILFRSCIVRPHWSDLSVVSDLWALNVLVRLRDSLSDRLQTKTTQVSYQRATQTVFVYPDDVQISEIRATPLDREQLCQLLAESENVQFVWRQGHELGLGKIYPSQNQVPLDVLSRVAHKMPKIVASVLV